ncbi:HAD-IC family P-type ATPase [Luteimonas sp. SJ-92]|uniref:HAD-IC family P-type ATPase n=1 Tax=Luteimonas salinisoli TaxID=2752307 RepID=A0A853JD78_9GAMM|nr:HAD-IC family P-type ATPase [Luteimonas salinisoli]NZA27256.1 HAD-IC family P-type ATPase [Luteimonas salinisoli]
MPAKPPPASPVSDVPWHACTAGDALARLQADRGGLDAAEAARRLQRHGRNELPATGGRPGWLRFLSQFNNALIYFLLAAAGAAGLLGHVVDAAVIAAVVVVNAIVGYVQEGKAERALDAIRRMISPQATVLRGGQRHTAAVADLVPGDVVLLDPGDRVPADLRLLAARSLLIDEAVLTGESVAAGKHEAAVDAAAALGDRSCMAWSGTLVAAGQGVGVVVATGSSTEIGRISTLIGAVRTLTTPLLRQIDSFGRRFTWVALAGAAALFAFAVLVRGFRWDEALMAVVALAVGVVPEGLPAVITITLAIGVQRMAARNAVIRRLPAVETLGATSVICTDKTGTLTRNEMTARQLLLPGRVLRVEGIGYAPDGRIVADGDDAAAVLAQAAPLLRAGLLCNDARLRQTDGTWSVEGDPMEGALVALAMKAGLAPDALRVECPRVDAIPFDAQHRFMATLHRNAEGGRVVFVKGAPERLLEMCSAQREDAGTRPLDHATWQAAIAAAAAEGERVLGFACKQVGDEVERLDFEGLGDGLQLLGLVGFIDPPREEAMAAIAECRSANIAVKMITGDHGATAAAIARQLGLAEDPDVVTGAQLDAVADADLGALAGATEVFARTSPEHKLRIVRALQAGGAVVAMTGDGVNDAPALKQADVGVAMGGKGTEAAKEASEMVLLDDNFASIVAAVHEGRVVYDNVRKVVGWTLPTNGGEMLAIATAILFGFTMPVTPVQILWINLVTAVTLGLVLAFEPAEDGVMKRAPRRASASLLTPFLVWRVVFVSLLFLAGALGVFAWALGRGHEVESARTLVVNTIVAMEIFYLFNVRYLHTASFTWRGAMGTPVVLGAVGAVVLAQLAFTYLPVMQALFATRAVGALDGLVVVGIGLALMLALEAEKLVLRRLGVLEAAA